MPDQHAKLSPSASERWLQCPASIKMEALVPKEAESVYAAEGTAAHALGELKASLVFGKVTRQEFIKKRSKWVRTHHITPDVESEMEVHTDEYVRILQERSVLYPHTIVMLEQRLNTGVPTCWGTSDAVLVSPRHVEIVDFKYGAGVEVEAAGNSQLRLYALGALDEFGDMLGETEIVRTTVHQPRIGEFGNLLTEEMTPDELRAWRDSIIPIAEEALGDDAHFGPSDTACRWCPASGRCRAQLESVFTTDFFEDPKLLEPEDVAKHLKLVPHVRAWLDAFEEASLAMAYSDGKTIPGYKVVLSAGRRSVVDHDAAFEALEKLGYSFDEIAKRTVKGIGELEKLLGKEKFKEVLEGTGYVRKSEGKPSLVPESDKRPSVSPNAEAAKEFRE